MFLVSNASRSVFCVPCSVFRVNVTRYGFDINSLNIYTLYQPIN